jgi:hypothetical protein
MGQNRPNAYGLKAVAAWPSPPYPAMKVAHYRAQGAHDACGACGLRAVGAGGGAVADNGGRAVVALG